MQLILEQHRRSKLYIYWNYLWAAPRKLENLFNYLFIYLFMKRLNIVLFNEYERVIFYPIIYFKKIEFEKNQPSIRG